MSNRSQITFSLIFIIAGIVFLGHEFHSCQKELAADRAREEERNSAYRKALETKSEDGVEVITLEPEETLVQIIRYGLQSWMHTEYLVENKTTHDLKLKCYDAVEGWTTKAIIRKHD